MALLVPDLNPVAINNDETYWFIEQYASPSKIDIKNFSSKFILRVMAA
jgi:hypothetical protein